MSGSYVNRDTMNGILSIARHLPPECQRDLAGALLAKLPVEEVARAIVDYVGDSISVPDAIMKARGEAS